MPVIPGAAQVRGNREGGGEEEEKEVEEEAKAEKANVKRMILFLRLLRQAVDFRKADYHCDNPGHIQNAVLDLWDFYMIKNAKNLQPTFFTTSLV